MFIAFQLYTNQPFSPSSKKRKCMFLLQSTVQIISSNAPMRMKENIRPNRNEPNLLHTSYCTYMVSSLHKSYCTYVVSSLHDDVREPLPGPHEGRVATQQDEQHDAAPPHVNRLAVRFPVHHLRRHELRGTDPT